MDSFPSLSIDRSIDLLEWWFRFPETERVDETWRVCSARSIFTRIISIHERERTELSRKGEHLVFCGHLACKVFRKGRGRRNREEGSMERKSGGNNKPMETRDPEPCEGIILPPVVHPRNSLILSISPSSSPLFSSLYPFSDLSPGDYKPKDALAR